MRLLPSTELRPLPRGQAGRALPIVLRAVSITSQVDGATKAAGDVEFRRGGAVIRADDLVYDGASDLVQASGHVRVSRDGAIYSGPALSLKVQDFEGSFTEPRFEFTQLGAGGSASRMDFLGPQRALALDARYTSCPRPDVDEAASGATAAEPAWELQARSVRFDIEANEGVAEGARLRFLGTTILALPKMSFPITGERKSGWLPPSVSIDNRSGLQLLVPYYWNIAPNFDATLSPRLITRRGAGLDSEFRYLLPEHQGAVAVEWLPHDQLAGSSRNALRWQHESELPLGLRFNTQALRVSDDDWWKDFPNTSGSFTSRLLPTRWSLERPVERFELAGLRGEGLVYARGTHWQVLQASDSTILSPYQRVPQLGLQLQARWSGLEMALQTEYNRFRLPDNQAATTQRVQGERWHALASISHPWREPGWFLVPRLSVNAARYGLPELPAAQPLASSGLPLTMPPNTALVASQRVIPSFSIDTGLEMERRTEAFGRALHQTLEPRLLYVNTPYRAQSQLPNYDAAAKDFNFVSIYSDNSFSGIDRVSDAHQLTAGFSTRLVDVETGAEALRLGLVQRYLFRDQRVTAQADGTPDGPPQTRRLSDALLLGSTSVLPGWTLDAAVQYSPDINRSVRSIVGARYSPGPYRTAGLTYRLARGLSEQAELSWQWPVWGQAARWGGKPDKASSGAGSCQGTWFSVGRLNYSLKDRRITDSTLGLEYDAGCWIGRFVVQQLSTGLSEATTRVLIQLELVGLSRLGSNPLQVLKDNIPGYQLLREERSSVQNPGP